MKTNYSIKNFRVFDNKGVSLGIKPITILTGCNSSGKSSIVKSLLLVCDYFAQLKSAKDNGKKIELPSFKLDFMKKPHNSLGKFSKVINRTCSEKDVIFAIQVHSDILAQDMTVEMTFSSDEKDDNTNGYLKSLVVKNSNGIIVYSSSKEMHLSGNLYALFPEFLRFVNTQSLLSDYQHADINRTIGTDDNYMSDEDFNKLVEDLKVNISEYEKKYGEASLLDLNRWNNAHRHNGSFLRKNGCDNSSIFMDMYKMEIVYYLPVLGKLNCTKTEALDFLKTCIEDTTDKALKSVLRKITSDFEQAEPESFIQYYKTKEECYLSNICRSRYPSKAPKLFHAKRLALAANSCFMSPYNCESTPISLFGNEEENHTLRKPKEKEIEEWEALPLTFDLLFEAMAILSGKFCPNEKKHYNWPKAYESFSYSSNTERIFFDFIEMVIEDIVVNGTPDALSYVSSSIINIQRLYPLESIDEFTQLLKNYLDAKRNMPVAMKYAPDSFMNKWVAKFGIGDSISVKVDDEGLGATIRLHKNSEDESYLLADNGYGITQLFAILLNIEVAIMSRQVADKLPDKCIESIPNSGKVELVCSTTTIAIEEPEIHLHPRYQSLLADMFVDAYKNYGINFIIETHSEYLIRKIQTLVAGVNEDLKLSNKDVSIQYVYSPSESERLNEPQVKDIGLCKDGYLNDNFGTGFFDEASSLSRQLM